ncbi:alpha/beta hydrolase [Halovulum sp. GXIMD14793]
MRLALGLIFVVLLCYSLLGGAALLFRRDLIYFFDPTPAQIGDIPRSTLKLLPSDGEDPQLSVWVTEPEAGKPVILYFMGNTGSLSLHEPRLRAMAEAGFGIAAMAYRGGGGQAGTPSEAALIRDAERTYAALPDLFAEEIPETDLVIYGYGLGSGLAIYMATQVEEMMLVLEAPFSRMCEVIETDFWVLPACAAMWDETWDNLARIDAVDTNTLFVHGYKDQTVPLRLGEKLFLATPDPKFSKGYAQAGHEDLPRHGALEFVIKRINVLRGAR